nr:SDR family oxidoreductase [Burkholderia contaminans]
MDRRDAEDARAQALGKAHDVGRAAVFLASDRANYITGQQLNVSGGYGL